jgi:hypothetical protein
MTRSEESQDQCACCKWWNRIREPPIIGECRARCPSVPTLRHRPQQPRELSGVWPITEQDGWCGDFKRRSEKLSLDELAELGETLDRYTDPNDPEYDAEFDKKIRALRPDWFIRPDQN